MLAAYLLIAHHAPPNPSVIDLAFISQAPIYAVGVAMMVGRRVGHSPWEGALDTAILTLGLGVGNCRPECVKRCCFVII
jgi:hypothetical protein